MSELMRCQNKNEWDEYIIDHDGHPLQLWGWGELKSAHGWSVERLFFYNNNSELVGAVQLLIKKLPLPFRALCYVPRGFVIDRDLEAEMLDALAIYSKKNYHAVMLKIEPDREEFKADGFVRTENYILPSKTIILDLNLPESDLMAAMAKKTRQYIRKSSSEPTMTIRQVKTRADLNRCLELYHQTADRANFSLHDDQYYYDAFDKLGDFSIIYAAYVDEKPVAFLWLTISGATAYELYGGMNEIGQNLRSNYALKWYAIKKCKEWGLGRYDFGGIIDGGVATFKRNWSESETELAGSFDRSLSKFYSSWNKWLPTAKKVIRKVKNRS